MRDCKVICDRCHTEQNTGTYPSTPIKDGWKDVDIKLDTYNHKTFSLCPKCLKEMGLVKEERNEMKNISEPSTQEKVFELLIEIVNQVVDERGQ